MSLCWGSVLPESMAIAEPTAPDVRKALSGCALKWQGSSNAKGFRAAAS